MTDITNRPPLWETMAEACAAHPQGVVDLRPAPVPAEGEVAELVEWLRRQASKWDVIDREAGLTRSLVAEHFTRAADLLERQAAPVPAGEVAESSVAPVPEPALARINGILSDSGRVLLTDVREALELAREALQQRQTAPVPVAVSERLPGVEDCDAKGKCWFFDPCDDGWWWYRSALFLDGDPSPLTHWLPATALPLPAGEGEK